MMVDFIPAPAYVKNREGTYIGCNQAFLSLLERTKDDVIGKNDYDLFPRSIADKLLHLDGELLQKGISQQADIKLVTADGTFIWVKLQHHVQKLEETEEPCIVAVVVDFTEEIKQEQRRSESLVTAAAAEMAIQTIEGMLDPVIILNEQGMVERVNKGYIDVVGPAKEIIGKQVSCLFQDIDEHTSAQLLIRCKEEGRIRNLEARLIAQQNKILPVLVNISRLKDSQQAINGFVIAIRDVSSLVAASEQLREKQRKLDALLNAADDAVLLLDREGIIKSGNRALSDRYHVKLENLLNHTYTDFADPVIREEQQFFIDEICAQGKPRRIEFEQNGRVYYNSGYPIFNDSGQVEEIAIFSYDITERKRGEQLQRALYSISEAAYFAKDVASLFSIVHRILSKLVSIDNLIIVLRDTSTGYLECPYYQVSAPATTADEAAERAFHTGLVDYLLQKGKAILLNYTELQKILDNKDLPRPDPLPLQWLGVPLMNGEGLTIGALVTHHYQHDKGYGEEDRKILNFVSSQIAMAIERKLNEDELRRKNNQLQLLTDGIILSLVRSVEIRDPYTAGHQQRVSLLASEIGRKLGLRDDRIAAVKIAALLHDVGKIAVPTELLSKPGKLSEIEMSLIRQHPVESYNILRNIQFPYPIAQYVLEHHEKYNGSGYPAGLKADAISLEGRIICVADVVDAISSHRPYRPSRGIEQALLEIKEYAGILYDPEVVNACLELFQEGFSFEHAKLNLDMQASIVSS
jgi:PAS domain S-box-containing protein/putative nucleotidyltransferase with HDIG domain